MRARVVAAVNVISAGYMTGAGLVFGLAQKRGVGARPLFLILALGNLAAMLLILRAWGKEGLRDLGTFVFSTLFRVELRGLDNMPPAGTRMVIAPNHVSLIDGPLVHVALPIDAAFAVDTTIANAWWAKPFMALIRAHLLDPTRPLAARALSRAVADGEPIVIFPEGRITVTGGLMKVYEGAAMIADKADAVIVPVRIDGAERSPFSYLRRTQIAQGLVPEDHGHHPAAAKAQRRPRAEGKGAPARRGRRAPGHHGRGRRAERRHRADALRGARRGEPQARREGARRRRGPARQQAHLPQADPFGANPRPQALAACRNRRSRRRALAELGGRRRDLLRLADERPRAGHAEFQLRAPRM